MKRTAIIVVQTAVIAGLLLRGDSLEGFGMGLVLGLVWGALVGAAFMFRERQPT
ncbi:O-antigen/teichoic acid export membrane protein [Bradyrhizobium japonicum]|jgi:hypothetical protein|uniref:hypothetical protein n=1 Tax=Bradyrhizobium TaxID=374 RepID=UPI0004B82C92|nr:MULTISPECIES: hypothetical protein [Bradyrhizobium]MBR0879516.1 hypothetical protein [Bradyrhizobium liaoningense]MBR0998751.1 hypothetical protein [Bradyrhizobium liaoningense]MBR1030031.1 hypothetical protein [Bradyrhizobium liaoningense]MBR1066913.1 hypothetical protein [Bradyrhizobium liaoningense]MDI2075540.1 hypothetical protein [Bradyrhizobium sp. Mp27]